MEVDFDVELKSYQVTDYKFLEEMQMDLINKAFCIFESQPNCHFLPSISFTDRIACLSIFDHGGSIHTQGFDIHQEPKIFLHMILGLMFGSNIQLGYDPTSQKKGNKLFVTSPQKRIQDN